MDSLLISRLTKDFLNQDPALTSQKQRYRMGWAGSILVSDRPKKEVKKDPYSFRERLAYLFATPEERPPVSLSTAPKLPKPKELPPASFAPPRTFSRGSLDTDPKTNPEPIRQLLTETHEMAQARPVPGRIPLIRSICKGKGTLRRNAQGLVFLDIDHRFTSMLLPYLKAHGLAEAPHFNLLGTRIGAHVPVISARESAFHYLGPVDQIGKEFSFEIEGLYSVTPTSWPEVEQVWFFKVHAPELENFRRSQFLPSVPGGHGFHIAVAVLPKSALREVPKTHPVMRINPAFSAA